MPGIVSVEKGITNEIKDLLEEDASFFIEKARTSQVVETKTLKEKIKAPIEQGTIIGEITYSVNDEILNKINIVANESVKKLNIINMTTNVYDNWFNLMR